MGIGIWKTKYSQLYDTLSQDEFDFIERNIPCSDDGTYELSKEYFSEINDRYSEKKELSKLIVTLDKYFKSGKSHLSFRIF